MSQSELEKVRQHDPGAIERWFGTYSDAVYTFAYYRVGKNADDAAEVVQDTFLQALQQFNEYDPSRGSMLAWLTCLSRNAIKKALGRRGRSVSYEQVWREIDQQLLGAFHLIATCPLPEQLLQRKETAELVQMTLANIPGNYRDVLMEHYCRNRGVKELAAAMELSEGAVKALLFRAREAFREALRVLLRSLHGPEMTIGDLYA